MLRRKPCIYLLILWMILSLATSCQKNVPYEVVLLPTKTPSPTASEVIGVVPTVENEIQEHVSDHNEPVSESKEIDDGAETDNDKTTVIPSATPELTPSPSPIQMTVPSEDMHYLVKRESKEVKALFSFVYDAVIQHCEKIELPKGTSKDQIEKVMWLLVNDCPELFWFSHISEYTYTEAEPNIILDVTAKYILSKEDAAKASQKIDALIDQWIQKTEGKSDYSKELYVHNALLDGCRYTNDSGNDATIYGALIRGKARCQGYANAMCYALRRMGIDCVVITGTATNAQGTEKHAWNLMKIDGTWTLTDPTWNDPIGRDIKQYAYFNITDEMMGRNHTADSIYSRYDLPNSTSLKQNYCVRNDVYWEDGKDVSDGIIGWAEGHLNGEGKDVICFETNEQYSQAMTVLAECLQKAVDRTGKLPDGGKFAYITEPDLNYLQFE